MKYHIGGLDKKKGEIANERVWYGANMSLVACLSETFEHYVFDQFRRKRFQRVKL